ncbi:DNA methylase [Pseudomonas aeruginosa]|uniref:type I restriction-modification system subunit M n=1 Tax=Pseudomonas aeruginosa TaxID=287 RepID=UPI00053EA8F4|nr:class I SAM-dependent DNA methyltransferase [Pseudomonas aeruginosa]EKN9357023.1 SAM-dependent DNA methyltransferase [Pseudomonas aeruginosa]KSM48227.1 DNA methylase [Pseudomonas aeruginosa]MBG4606734.1 SAM-dependent DNA methyltransferase [Pseudomonas aeruginosa]MBG5781725.1 SAM-dependent DNA methyltransferase [Pseudomonas aeruginosa]MBI8521938.1 SAM-dependent DNA methyltransferase [Pseudomonas aeruginosa]
MNHAVHNKLVSFIWSIADDCLRDVYVRGKYRDVILPMVVLRRLDALLEPSKAKVMEELAFQQGEMGLTELDESALQAASGYVFYNISKWTLSQLHKTATNNQQILLTNFEEYLDGFSGNVKDIIRRFNLKAQVRHMAAKDVLLDVLEKFTSPYINLTPKDIEDPEGNRLPALSNLGMGYVFEELIRKFNEENNEEAGEHFTPREVIELMTHLVFDPIKDRLPTVMTIYDPACGSGGMLTESQNFIEEKYPAQGIQRDIHLYGKEINDETYAICKSDMMIKGNDPAHIRPGSTLSVDEFAGSRFDFMLSNPPYGKSWASEQKFIKEDGEVIDPRFKVRLKDYWGHEEVQDATPRSSDGQLLFLMEMVSKMKAPGETGIGSRIASVHNGSSLFTGDAGGGESNIRRHIIENDLLEAIIQLPNNLFYNTGITTYIWLLSSNKPAQRRGKVQLIDASLLYRKLRKNLGNKNCEFAPEHIELITRTYLELASIDRPAGGDGIAARVFDNRDFGYHKVSIERPDRRKAQFSSERIETLRFDKALREPMQWIYQQWGEAVYQDETLAQQQKAILAWCEEQGLELNAKQRKKLLSPETWAKQSLLVTVANYLMQAIGTDEFDDFNLFAKQVDKVLKQLGKEAGIKLGASERNQLLNAVSWYDENAAKVIRKVEKFDREQLAALLQRLGCSEAELPDFGYYPHGKPGEFVTYESSSDLRDSESIPLADSIHRFFKAEVQPHVEEAWINLESVKIGYEISFNKYFYKHQPLRSMEEVAREIVALERQAEGLIAEILGLESKDFSGVAND